MLATMNVYYVDLLRVYWGRVLRALRDFWILSACFVYFGLITIICEFPLWQSYTTSFAPQEELPWLTSMHFLDEAYGLMEYLHMVAQPAQQ